MDNQNNSNKTPEISDNTTPQTQPVVQPSQNFIDEIAKQKLEAIQENTNPKPVSTSSNTLSIYPTETSDSNLLNNNLTQSPLTRSEIAQEKKPLHWGIYIIAGYNILAFALSFLSSSQTNTIYAIAMFIDLLLGIGLILRLELARKIMVWLAGIIIILSVISLILLVGLQQRIAQSKLNYNKTISQYSQQQTTTQQQQQLALIQETITNQQKQAGHAIAITYLKESASFIEGLVVIIYLTRPKIKDVFLQQLPA